MTGWVWAIIIVFAVLVILSTVPQFGRWLTRLLQWFRTQ